MCYNPCRSDTLSSAIKKVFQKFLLEFDEVRRRLRRQEVKALLRSRCAPCIVLHAAILARV